MEVMLIRLSCDHRSNARSTSFSATDVSAGNVLVRICSQRPRIDCDLPKTTLPELIDLFNSAMRVFLVFQRFVSGVRIILSPTQIAIAVMARIESSFWRFVMVIAQPPSHPNGN